HPGRDGAAPVVGAAAESSPGGTAGCQPAPRGLLNRGASQRLALVLLGVVLSLVPQAPGQPVRRPACCPAVCPTMPPPATAGRAVAGPAEEDAIRAVLDAQVAAWNKGDLEAFMEGYWASPDLTFFAAGNRTQGWQATLERYRKRYQAEGQEMGRLTFSDLEVELLGPDAAFVRGRLQLERSKDRPSGRFPLVFRRLPEGWRIIHDHTSS